MPDKSHASDVIAHGFKMVTASQASVTASHNSLGVCQGHLSSCRTSLASEASAYKVALSELKQAHVVELYDALDRERRQCDLKVQAACADKAESNAETSGSIALSTVVTALTKKAAVELGQCTDQVDDLNARLRESKLMQPKFKSVACETLPRLTLPVLPASNATLIEDVPRVKRATSVQLDSFRHVPFCVDPRSITTQIREDWSAKNITFDSAVLSVFDQLPIYVPSCPLDATQQGQ